MYTVKVGSKFFDVSAIRDSCASKNVEKNFNFEIHGKILKCVIRP